MKVKKIKVGIKDLKSVLDDFVKTGEAIDNVQQLKPFRRQGLSERLKAREVSSLLLRNFFSTLNGFSSFYKVVENRL